MLEILELFGVVATTLFFGHYITAPHAVAVEQCRLKLKDSHSESATEKDSDTDTGTPISEPRKMVAPKMDAPYLVHQIRMGRNHLMKRDFEEAAHHFANATLLCGRKKQLLHMLESTMPDKAYEMLLRKLMQVATADIQLIAQNFLLKRTSPAASVDNESEA